MEGLNSKKGENKLKMTWPNMALTNMDKRRPNFVSKRERTVERERREGEKKKKRKRKRRRRGEEEKPR